MLVFRTFLDFYFLLDFFAANTPTSEVDDATTEQSSGLTNSPNTSGGVVVNHANPAVSAPEGGFSAEGDLFGIMPESLNPFNENTSSFHPSLTLPEDKRSGTIFHHNDKSSEELSVVRLQIDLEHPPISATLGSQDRLITTNSLPLLAVNDLSTINVSKTNTVEGNTSHNQTDGRIQDGLNILPLLDNQEEVFDSKSLNVSRPYKSEESNTDRSAEGSGSGSGLYSNRLNQEFDGVAIVKTDLQVHHTGKKSRSTGIKMDSGTGDVRDGAGSKISSKKECETAAEKEMEGNDSELSDEEEEETEGEGVHHTGSQRVRKVDGETNESARPLNSTAGCDMLEDKERETDVETIAVKTIYTETGSGYETESNISVFSWPEDVSGSGGGGGDGREDGKGKGKKVSDDIEGIKAVGEKEGSDKGDGGEDSNKEVVTGRKDGVQRSVSPDKPTADFPLFDSSGENGNGGGDGHDEEGRNINLESQVDVGNITPEDNKEGDGDGKRNGGLKSGEHVRGGGKDDSNAAVIGESLQQFSSVDGLLFDAARRRLVPLLRLTDGSKATEEKMEGNCYSVLSFSSALPLTECDRAV